MRTTPATTLNPTVSHTSVLTAWALAWSAYGRNHVGIPAQGAGVDASLPLR